MSQRKTRAAKPISSNSRNLIRSPASTSSSRKRRLNKRDPPDPTRVGSRNCPRRGLRGAHDDAVTSLAPSRIKSDIGAFSDPFAVIAAGDGGGHADANCHREYLTAGLQGERL